MKILIGTCIFIWLAFMVVFCYAMLVAAGRADKLEEDLFDQYLRELTEEQDISTNTTE